MFIYDKSKNVSIFTRGKNGTTNFHNHYWMQKDHQSVGSYRDFDDSEWQFANPLPAVEDMVRGCVNSNLNNHQAGEDFYQSGNRRLGMYVWEYITFLKTCKLLGQDVEHYIVVRDPLQRLASGLSTAIQNTPDEEAQRVTGSTFDALNDRCKTHKMLYNDGFVNKLIEDILRLQGSQYHAQSWLYHLDKHIDIQDFNIQAIDIYDIVPFAKDKLDIDLIETDKDDEHWHGKHTGTRAPDTRYFHNFLIKWLGEAHENGRMTGPGKHLLDREYQVYNNLTIKYYDINN